MSVEFVQYVLEDCALVKGLVKGNETCGIVFHSSPKKTYEPMRDEPTLFKKFAKVGSRQVPPDVNTIFAFARVYGNLGRFAAMTLTEGNKLPPWFPSRQGELLMRDQTGQRVVVELLDDWRNESEHMAAVYAFHSAVEQKDMSKLKDIVRLGPSDEPRRLSCHVDYGYANEDCFVDLNLLRNSHLRPAYDTRQILPLARACLVQIVNKHLDDTSVSFNKAENVMELRKGNTRAGIVSRADGGLELHIIPTNLLGAMWLQFAQAVTGQREFKTCPNCGNDFEVGWEKAEASSQGELKKRSAKYCSTFCHDAYHNKKKSERRAISE